MTTTIPDTAIEDRLGDRDVRYTSGRRRVVAALSASDGPRSAAELHMDTDEAVPLSSLYRSLVVLDEAGVVTRHFGPDGVTRYELAEWLKGHHHHLVCIECGAVDDIVLTTTQERRVRRAIDEIAEAASFQPLDHTLEIQGICRRCS